MSSRSRAPRCSVTCAALAAWITFGLTTPPVARAADDVQPAGEAPGARGNQEARLLFSQGQIHYSLGEYDLAVAAFRRAYELSAAPGLLFNIAQAHRLNGQCKQALEAYRHFTRLVPTSEYRAEAETQIAALTVRCGEAPATAPAERSEVAKPVQPLELGTTAVLEATAAVPAAPRWSTRRRTAVALLAGGVGLGLAAGGIAWWNNGRYDDWRTEDQRLATPTTGTTPQVWLADQERNDSLLRSIQHVDTFDLTLAAVAIVAVIASAVVLVASER